MFKQRYLLAIAAVMLLAGCYPGIDGTVVDAETGKPIEGAVVLVEWTKTEGIGLTYTESYKVIETVTDKDGKFTVGGKYSPIGNAPNMTIFKKDYVTWSSRWIFPGWKGRTDFGWRSGTTYRLEKFKDTYSYVDLDGFTSASINSTIGSEKKQLFRKLYDEATREKFIKEMDERNAKRVRGGIR